MMQIDAQTFKDLEIFAGREGKPGLFSMLDRARTREGAAALRRRFLRPHSTAQGILDVQSSLKFITANRDCFRVPGQYAVSGFQHYFNWHLSAPASSHPLGLVVDALQMMLGHHRERQRLGIGVRETVRILRFVTAIGHLRELADAPGELGALLNEVRQLTASSSVGRLRLDHEERWNVLRLLRVDRVLRHEARDAVTRLVHILFEIDALVAMADATVEHGFHFPQVLDGDARIIAEGVWHPFLQEAVPNPIDIGESHRLLFLTGPNMAGKTTYLRSGGIAIYLAHLGMGVPAVKFAFTPAQSLITAISLSDDVRAGISFFQAEAIRARLVASSLAERMRSVVILDEPFKGTNVKDALDASVAFLSRIAGFEGSLFIVASHLIEAGEVLERDGLAECMRFEATEEADTLAFDYLLRAGLSTQRLGMRVLQEHGVFDLLDAAIPLVG